MKIFYNAFLFMVCFWILSAYSDDIIWTEQSSTLPNGVKLFKGTRNSPKLQAFYLDVDLSNPDIAVRPYISSTSKTVPTLTSQFGAYAAINGGFFGGSTSYSAVIYPGEIKAINVQAVTRNSQSYPVIRSLFSMDTTGQFAVDWIYHFDNTISGVYTFGQPLAYSYNDPTPRAAPQKADGQSYGSLLLGIGGAPTLVKDSQVNVTYNEEIMWGSGVGYDNGDPRTAVGYTADGHVILFVADGRQDNLSLGVSLPELAQIMIDLGCVEAMNLDGGGSTQMAIGNTYVNSPSEHRSVPSILAVVHKDSLGLPKKPLIEKIIDTEDTEVQLIGGGWFESANAGYWGTSRSLLNPKGDGSAYAIYRPGLKTAAAYEVYAWWVAASNRCKDTPFVIRHYHGVDTVRLDQTANGSSWVKVGMFNFTGDTSEALIISNAATVGDYVVADGVKFVTYDTSGFSNIRHNFEKPVDHFELFQNYPNPFNPVTTIRYTVGTHHDVPVLIDLSIYNLSGQKVATLVSAKQSAGHYEVQWDASGMASGVYLYRLSTGSGFTQTRKLVLLR